MAPSQPGTWDVAETRTFVYDGWNLYREVETSGGATVTNIYIWGLDLSGTLQGAGGVGGLLAVLRNGTRYFPCYDANGNVTDYVDCVGSVRAHYEYSPFGETTAQYGDLADTFHFRFSTKYYDVETHSYYYGYRHYAPKFGCWLSKDPIGEEGGWNLYNFASNNGVNIIDVLGQKITLVDKKDFNQESISASSHGSGRGQTIIEKGGPAISCDHCKFKVSGVFKRTMLILMSSNSAWNTRLRQYDIKWGTQRSNEREREATIAHENDHWNSYKLLVNFLTELNRLDDQKLNDCEQFSKTFRDQFDSLFKLSTERSKLFDTAPWNQGGMYEN